MTRSWLLALLRRRPSAVLVPAGAVAVAVALLASLGLFVASSKATMTARAVSSVTVDWQVEVQPSANPAEVSAVVGSAPGTVEALAVDVGRVAGLSSTVGGTTQSTGAAVVLGLPPNYRAVFPGELRALAGSDAGVLVAQQTASNLRVTVGDRVTVHRPDGTTFEVRVDGVVDLPAADSLFQKVGAPSQSQPAAPPDNVLILPHETFSASLGSLSARDPAALTHQIHVRRSHDLPPDPAAAYATESGQARNLEAASAGTARVGDNLGATLDAARKDALYAQVLFVFLGAPGAILAGLLTAVVAGAAADRRRRDQAVLRLRGASRRQVFGLVTAEALLVGALGSVVGIVVAAGLSRLAFGSVSFGADASTAAVWLGVSVATGLVVALLSIVLPLRKAWREQTVVGTGREVGRADGRRLWERLWLDVVLLAAALLVFRITSDAGYSLVLAPEGVPSISVNYWAFLGPTLLWLGGGLLILRLVGLLSRHGSRLVAAVARPLSGPLAGTVAASLSRQRRVTATAVVMLALAVSFAVSTSTFNDTYRQQAEVDARLTNGADVLVTPHPGPGQSTSLAASLSSLPGVATVEPIQHRFAYVGADLQDLYGVNAATIASATSLQDAYFQGGTATSLMAALRSTPDGVLVSDETVKDFQLNPGDLLRLRLTDPHGGAPVTVPFHYVGIVKEFPTAPSDSFLVANAAYVARATGSAAVGAYLVNTDGAAPSAVAAQAAKLVGTTAAVSTIGDVRGHIGTSLTSVDLRGLSSVELVFALAMAGAGGGLVLFLGLRERRRMFAILRLLGARGRRLTGFVVTEVVITTVLGLAAGAMLGWAMSQMLVTVLTGVFDPPPAALSVPWPYLVLLVVSVVGCIGAAATVAAHQARRADPAMLRAQ